MLVIFSVASFQFSLSVISDSVKFVKNDAIQGCRVNGGYLS